MGKHEKQHEVYTNSLQSKEGTLSLEPGDINLLPNKKEEKEGEKKGWRKILKYLIFNLRIQGVLLIYEMETSGHDEKLILY